LHEQAILRAPANEAADAGSYGGDVAAGGLHLRRLPVSAIMR